MPLFKTKKEIFDWIKNGQKTVDIRKGKAWKGETAIFQWGPHILRLRIIKKEEGALTQVLRTDNYKAVIPTANSLNEAIDYLQGLYGTTDRTFTAYYLEHVQRKKRDY